jgi:hypothetical protein
MTASELCLVCHEALAEPNVASCMECGQRYHLQMRMNVDGKDCGQVWIDDFDPHLVFACQCCLDAATAGLQ